MDFSWTEQQIAFREQVLRFAECELNDNVVERDKSGEFYWDGWRRCAEFGVQKLMIPQQYSGKQPKDFMTSVLAMEALGRGCRDSGLTLGLNAHMWTVQLPILNFGAEDLKARYLPKMCCGEWIGAHAITEPDYGSDVANIKTHAQKVDGGYVLNGKKALITFAPIADVILVFATVNPEHGKWGMTAFIIEKSFQGVQASPVKEKMGLRTVPFGDLTFDNCFVPEQNILGREGGGAAISSETLQFDRCFILASHIGAMERQLQTAIDYAKNRQQSGQSIGKFQSVSNRIADMKVRLETARLLLYQVAWLKQQGRSAAMESAMLKLHLSEQYVASSLDAIRIHGGIGYTSECGVERGLRDAVGGVLYAGTSDIQRNIIAGLLGL